jgi:hypothetical protein
MEKWETGAKYQRNTLGVVRHHTGQHVILKTRIRIYILDFMWVYNQTIQRNESREQYIFLMFCCVGYFSPPIQNKWDLLIRE